MGGGGAANIDPGELMGLVTEMANDPEVMALASNPKIMALAKDPSIMNTLLSGNMAAIEANPKIKELMNEPAIQKLVERMKNKKSGGAQTPSGTGQPGGNADIDKIFE